MEGGVYQYVPPSISIVPTINRWKRAAHSVCVPPRCMRRACSAKLCEAPLLSSWTCDLVSQGAKAAWKGGAKYMAKGSAPL